MIKYYLIILISSLFLYSCSDDSGRAKKEKEINLSLTGLVETLDPAKSYDTISNTVLYQSYEPLYEYHYLKRPYTIRPLLAQDMPKISNNGTRYTIKIKKNIRYHDDPAFEGKIRYVRAEDFITQIKRLAFIPTRSNGWWLFDNKIKGLNEFRKKVGEDFNKFQKHNISGVNAPDDHTLVIDLTRPSPQMFFTLTMGFTTPIPIEVVKKYNNDLSDRMVGTGPFELVRWIPKSVINLKKFKYYRDAFYPSSGDRLANTKNLLADAGKKIPFLDKVNFYIVNEDQPRWIKFRSKKIDSLVLPKDNYDLAINQYGNLTKELQKDNIQLQITPTLTYWKLSFNMQDKIVGSNRYLRLAIAHAIDYQKYIQAFTNNTGQRANSLYLPGVPGYRPSIGLPYDLNIKKAKKYLKLAGYPNGKGLPALRFDTRGMNSTHKQHANFIKTSLEKVGINIKIVYNNFPSFLKKSRKNTLQFWEDGWTLDYPYAENILQLLYSKNHSPGPNSSHYSSKEFDRLHDKLKTMFNMPKKFKLMNEIEDIVNHDIPWIMLYYERRYILSHKRVKNIRYSDVVYGYAKYLDVK